MADILLAKPETGSQTITCEPDAKFVFNFPTSDATLARDGDNLNINFADGSSLNLQGFYTQYNEENLPSFNIDGTEVAAADFFAAMNEPDLMPAAGPGAGTSGATGGRFHEYDNMALAGGLQHLNGLDWGMNRGFEWEEHPYSVGRNSDDDWGRNGDTGGNNPVTVEPTRPGVLPPNTPIMPGQPGQPGFAGPDGNNGISGVRDVLQVYERGLVDGDPSKIIVSGSMDITAPDGVGTIVIGGVTVWENGANVPGASVSTDEGVLSNISYDPSTGKLTYTYTLEKNTLEHRQPGDDNIGHNIPVTVTDVDGDSDTSYITIVIRDDVPEAEDDVNSVRSDSTEPVTGNVLDNDTFGADGPSAQNPVTLVSDPKGEYGTIVLNPDGTYSFTLDPDNEAIKNLRPGETLTQEFEYTITDADGDTSTATLVITINGVNNPVTVTPENPQPTPPDVPNIPDPDHPGNPDNPEDPSNPGNVGVGVGRDVLQVYEKGLEDGDTSKTQVNGAMTVTAPDGVGTIAVGGVIVWENGELVPDVTVPVHEGTLSNFSFDPDTGKLTYTYTLNESTQEHKGKGEDSIAHNVKVTVTDVDGDQGSAYITVVITDDVPVAAQDRNTATEGETVGGTVLVNDNFGADGEGAFPNGATVRWDNLPENSEYHAGTNGQPGYYVVTIDGIGTATLFEDGRYEFTADDRIDGLTPSTPNVPPVIFNYSIVDSDGDISSTTLTIDLAPKNEPVDITPSPDPDNPPVTPDDPDNPPTDPDDPDNPDNPDPEIPEDPEHPDNPDDPDSPINLGRDVLHVYEEGLTEDGDKSLLVAKGGMDISAPDGLATITVGGVVVWQNGHIVEGVQIATDEGVLSDFAYADGRLTYTYTLQQNTLEHQGDDKKDSIAHNIKVTATDADGDESSAYVTIVIRDDVPEAADDSNTVTEGAKIAGNVLANDEFGADDKGAFANGATVRWDNLPDNAEYHEGANGQPGYYTVVIEGVGTATLFENGRYEFAALGDIEGLTPATPDVVPPFSFDYTIVDADGDTSSATLTIDVAPKDEPVTIVPTPDPETPPTDPDDPDNPPTDPENPDIPEDPEHPDNPDDPDSPINLGRDVLHVYEEGLTEDGDKSLLVAQGGMDITAPDGLATITVGGVVVWQNGQIVEGVQIATDEGVLSDFAYADGRLTYTYTLEKNTLEHQGDNGKNSIAHNIKVTAIDTDGDEASAYVTVVIGDDIPQAADDGDISITEGATEPVTGNVLENDDFGADGAASKNSVQLVGDGKGEYGTITIDANGNYSFTLNGDNPDVKALTKGETLTQQFQYKITDADGDTSTATITITINGVNNPVTIVPKDPEPTPPDTPDIPDPDNPPKDPEDLPLDMKYDVVKVNEKDWAEGDANQAKTTGAMIIDAPDGVKTITVGGVAVFKNGAIDPNATVTVHEGTFSNFAYNAATGELSYTYTLNAPTQEHEGEGRDQISHTLKVTVEDSDGDTASSYIKVVIVDDVPEAADDYATVTEGEKIDGNVVTSNDDYNADGVGAFEDDKAVHWDVPANTQYVSGTNGNPGYYQITIDGKGEVKLFDNGNYEFKANTKIEGFTPDATPEKFTYNYSIIDKDGDVASSTLTITLKPNPDTPDITTPKDPANPNLAGLEVNVDEGALGGNGAGHDIHGKDGNGAFTVDLHGEDGTLSFTYNGQTYPFELVNNGGKVELGTEITLANGVKVTLIEAVQNGTDGNWKVNYSYVLTGAQQHLGEGHVNKIDGEDVLTNYIGIKVTDVTGDETTAQITVNVHDDGPVLTLTQSDPTNLMAGSGVHTGTLAAYFGADNGDGKSFTVTINGTEHDFVPGQENVIEGAYGVLTVAADGTYVYKANENATGEDSFVFKITDSDDDYKTATLNVSVQKPAGPKDPIQPVEVNEKGLEIDDTSDDSLARSEWADVTAPAGYEIIAGGTGKFGSISLVDGVWKYKLDKAMDSTDEAVKGDSVANPIKGADSVTVTVRDKHGNTYEMVVDVDIIDDVPEIAVGDKLDYASDHAYTIHGNGSFDFGADDWDKALDKDGKEHTGDKSLVLEMTRGDEKFTATGHEDTDGTWSFTLADEAGVSGGTVIMQPDADGTFTFTYATPKDESGRNESLNDSETNNLDYNFKFTITDSDGDHVSADVGCTIKPTNILHVPDPTPTPGDEEVFSPEYDPEIPGPGGEAEAIDNIIIGSTTPYMAPETVYNLSFLFDVSGSCSVQKTGWSGKTTADIEALGFTKDTTIAAQKGESGKYDDYYGFTKTTKGENGENITQYFFHGKDGNLYEYTSLYHSMQQTMNYIEDVYNEIQPGSTVNILLGGFDIKVESSLEFVISKGDANSPTEISVTKHLSQTLRIDGNDKLSTPALTSNGKEETIRYHLDPETPDGKDIGSWLQSIFHNFNESIVYNIGTAFGENAYTYTATNVDNALGYAQGWFHNIQPDQTDPNVKVVNKTFLLTDGGATAHTEPLTGSHNFIYGWNGGYKGQYNLGKVLDVWEGEAAADAGWAGWTGVHSWSDVKWEPGQTMVVKVAGGANDATPKVIVINQLGMVQVASDADTVVDAITNTTALKYVTGASGTHGGKDIHNASPVVMDWVSDGKGGGYFAPAVSFGTLNNHGLGDNNLIDTWDKPSQGNCVDTAKDMIKNGIDITVIKFGSQFGDDLPQYATGGADGGNIIHVDDDNGWGGLVEAYKNNIAKAVSDTIHGNRGDDILFGDILTVPDELLKDGKYSSEKIQEANLSVLAGMVGMDISSSTPADIAAELWNRSDEVAAKLDKIGSGEGGNDTLIGGDDNDLLFGMNGKDVLFGDGNANSLKALAAEMDKIDGIDNVKATASSIVEQMTSNLDKVEEIASKIDSLEAGGDDGNDKLYGGQGNDVLIGGAGNDILMGGAGDDFLFGGSGDDYLNGGAGKDTMFGGIGNDIIVFDNSDYLIDGGTGLDFMVTDESNPATLEQMMANYNAQNPNGNMPMVHNVDVMLSGKGVDTSLTSIKSMAEKYGFTVSKDKDGNDVLTLGKNWKPVDTDHSDGTISFQNGDITLETTMELQSTDSTSGETEAAITLIANSNG